MTNTKDLQNSNKTQTSQNHKSLTADEITISETEIIPEKQFEQSSELSLLSPSMVTKNKYNILQSTPDTIDSSTPSINSSLQKTSPVPQDQQQCKSK